jgi:hypothetical protein
MTPDRALLLRRAGLERTVENPTDAEIQALADAGDRLYQEHVAYLLWALENRVEALRRFDGGRGVREQLRALVYSTSRPEVE